MGYVYDIKITEKSGLSVISGINFLTSVKIIEKFRKP